MSEADRRSEGPAAEWSLAGALMLAGFARPRTRQLGWRASVGCVPLKSRLVEARGQETVLVEQLGGRAVTSYERGVLVTRAAMTRTTHKIASVSFS
jgi:hypothetical protein